VLGGGGMGMVYRAEDLKLGRHVALKFLPEELAGDPIALQRLELEARTASALNHPNICTIHDIEDYEGQSFIVMELLVGKTLQQHLADSAPHPMASGPLIDVAVQVCAGLEAAHGRSIVHRDIKPANIFLTKQGTVKILDFGVAKLVSGDGKLVGAFMIVPDGQGPAPEPGLTRTGVTVGTRGYMSPEQVRREELDGRSDLFSLGLVLYEMATGRRAFTGETVAAVQEAILTVTPPAADAVNAAVPRLLAAIIARALEKDRAHRYQTAADLRHQLERARVQLIQPATRPMRFWLPVGGAVIAAGAAAVWLGAPRLSRATLAPSDTIVLAQLTNATSDRVFDEALYTALRIGLEQTPYLNVLADDKVRGTLVTLGLDEHARITPELALQVCRRTGSRIMVAPAIADAGNRLRLELKGMDCESGSTISKLENEAASRDGVIAALGVAALRLRRELGEPESSVATYDSPLQEATSSSPEALELLTLGYRRQLAASSQDAIPFYQRAVQADPELGLAHSALSGAYGNVGERELSAAASRRAFDLRNRMTAPARFNAESTYQWEVMGDWEESCAVLARWVQGFPHDVIARNNYSLCLSVLGQPDRALGEAREAARLLPAAHTYWHWILRSVLADRLDEAQKTRDDALRRGFDSTSLRRMRALLAFLSGDDAAIQEQWAWAAGRVDARSLFQAKAMVEEYHGQLRAALRSADASGDTDHAIRMALLRVEVGLAPTRPVVVASNQPLAARLVGALALARAGHTEEARLAANGLRQDYPSNTVVQKYGLPLIDAAARLQSNDAAGAVTVLEPATKYDLTSLAILPALPTLYSPYLRGLAYLRSGKTSEGAAEFEKILAHPGLVGWCVIGPLARLQLARAQHARGDDTAALASYERFLALWQDADADVPLYRAAKAEYQGLRERQPSK
jgi:tetratricopeptide (TPR) repeat protein